MHVWCKRFPVIHFLHLHFHLEGMEELAKKVNLSLKTVNLVPGLLTRLSHMGPDSIILGKEVSNAGPDIPETPIGRKKGNNHPFGTL